MTIVKSEVGRWKAPAERPIDVVVADPARSGLGKPGVSVLTAGKPAVLVLVSCDPVSLARDVTLMVAAGYRGRVGGGARPVPEHAAHRDGHPFRPPLTRRLPIAARSAAHESRSHGGLAHFERAESDLFRRGCRCPGPTGCPSSRSSRPSSPTSVCRRRSTGRRSNDARQRSARAGRSQRSPQCSTVRCGSGCPMPNTSGFSGRPARWPSVTSRSPSPSAGTSARRRCRHRWRSRLQPACRCSPRAASAGCTEGRS